MIQRLKQLVGTLLCACMLVTPELSLASSSSQPRLLPSINRCDSQAVVQPLLSTHTRQGDEWSRRNTGFGLLTKTVGLGIVAAEPASAAISNVLQNDVISHVVVFL